MRRLALVSVLACMFFTAAGFAQAPQAPAQPAKYIPPVKGVATIEVIQMPTKRDGADLVTVIKVRNTADGSINLLKVDEYWYDAQSKIVSGAPYAHKKAPIRPGEIVEITLRSPFKPTAQRQQIMFRHANGDIKAKAVKEFK